MTATRELLTWPAHLATSTSAFTQVPMLSVTGEFVGRRFHD